jgi:hypothetical protein
LTYRQSWPRLSRILQLANDCEYIMSVPNSSSEPGANNEPSVDDRRMAQRYPLNIQTTGHVLGPRGGLSWVAEITDISATGIGLLYGSRIKPATVLVITLQGANQKLSRPFPVRVMRATLQEDNSWLHGCAFIRKVNEEDLQGLLSKVSSES